MIERKLTYDIEPEYIPFAPEWRNSQIEFINTGSRIRIIEAYRDSAKKSIYLQFEVTALRTDFHDN